MIGEKIKYMIETHPRAPQYPTQGAILFVDLSSGRVEKRYTAKSVVMNFLGGRGLNMYYLYNLLEPGVDPFSPDNPLIFGAGFLTGTLTPSASRMNATAKSPESMILGDSNAGDYLGAKLKANNGIDRIIFYGKAEAPVYLYIEDGKAELLDASDYWGLDNIDLREKLKQKYSAGIEIANITRAGENMARLTGIMAGDKAIFARGGLGGVMGSKNLKAIVAKGKGKFEYENKEAMVENRKALNEYLKRSGVIKVLGEFGTPFLFRPSNTLGAIRTMNSQQNSFDESLNVEAWISNDVKKMVSCSTCPVHCRHVNEIAGYKDRYSKGKGPEYVTIGLIGANTGIGNPTDVTYLNNICNDLGLDTSSIGTIVPWAFELYQRGIIGDETTGGLKLKWGDVGLVEKLLFDISARKGFGNVLAESTQAVSLGHFPEKALDYLIAVKGLPQSDPHDPRILKGFSLGIAVSTRGADHLRNRPTLEIMQLPDKLKQEIYGGEVSNDITSYDTKALMVYASETIYAVGDSLGVCRFTTHLFNSPNLLKYEHFSTLIKDATGLRFSVDELRKIGDRIICLERMINHQEGMRRKDDTLPKRYFDDPLLKGGYGDEKRGKGKGERIDRERFEIMLDEYYDLRGLDKKEGIPVKKKSKEIEVTTGIDV